MINPNDHNIRVGEWDVYGRFAHSISGAFCDLTHRVLAMCLAPTTSGDLLAYACTAQGRRLPVALIHESGRIDVLDPAEEMFGEEIATELVRRALGCMDRRRK